MVTEAHRLGMQVLPWTTNSINLVDRLVHDYKVDGFISDCEFFSILWASMYLPLVIIIVLSDPHDMLRWAKFEANLPVAPTYPVDRVFKCLAKYNQVDSTSYLHQVI